MVTLNKCSLPDLGKLQTLCNIMNKILLRIETGDWDGGNNGRYPKLLECNLEDEDYPIDESDGWGAWLRWC